MNALLLAAAVPEPAKRTTEGDKAGPIGLAVILVLCIACYFLFKSMSKHMKKVREEFPAEAPVRSRTTVSATVVSPAHAPGGVVSPDAAGATDPGPGPDGPAAPDAATEPDHG